MFLSLLNWIWKHFSNEDQLSTLFNNHIKSHNPQNNGDVERLEREFIDILTRGKLL